MLAALRASQIGKNAITQAGSAMANRANMLIQAKGMEKDTDNANYITNLKSYLKSTTLEPNYGKSLMDALVRDT